MKNALIALLFTAPIIGAQQSSCAPTPPAPCNEEACCRTYCLGPVNPGINAPVNPITCNGDWLVSVTGFYWNFHQSKMEFAIDNAVTLEDWENNFLFINADFVEPKTSWDFGFKVGLGYNTTCDGWDFGVEWTRFDGNSQTHIEREEDDNHTLLSLWSYLLAPNDEKTLANVTDIVANWDLDLNLVDVELGRASWNSKRLSLRPFVGLRFASIKQKFNLLQKGGEFSDVSPIVNDEVDIDNDFRGFGARGGLDTTWNFGCGWAIYGDLAFSLVYGRFTIDQDEQYRDAETPFTKTKVLEVDHSFRVLNYITDLELGIQWSALFCDCNYGITVSLGWEAHIFFDQNQMNRIRHEQENIWITPLSGNLDTQGWTLSVELAF